VNAATESAQSALENEYRDPPIEFAQLGINVTILSPSRTGLYPAESNQVRAAHRGDLRLGV
jgi:hypothetical protein